MDSLSGGESFLGRWRWRWPYPACRRARPRSNRCLSTKGFGTLDPDSLDLALASPDSLQAAGRQIGSSPTQTLVERIGVQVRVEEPLGGGESRATRCCPADEVSPWPSMNKKGPVTGNAG